MYFMKYIPIYEYAFKQNIVTRNLTSHTELTEDCFVAPSLFHFMFHRLRISRVETGKPANFNGQSHNKFAYKKYSGIPSSRFFGNKIQCRHK